MSCILCHVCNEIIDTDEKDFCFILNKCEDCMSDEELEEYMEYLS